jgi:hypothetical protein
VVGGFGEHGARAAGGGTITTCIGATIIVTVTVTITVAVA